MTPEPITPAGPYDAPRTDEALSDLALLGSAIAGPLLDGLHELAERISRPARVEVAPSDYWQVVTARLDATAPPSFILGRDLLRCRVAVRNIGTAVAYLGPDPSNLTTGTGLVLNPGDAVSIDTRAGLAAIAAGATTLQLVIEHSLAEA
jgi:hypothetical protein